MCSSEKDHCGSGRVQQGTVVAVMQGDIQVVSLSFKGIIKIVSVALRALTLAHCVG